jgi:hypothetical protein
MIDNFRNNGLNPGNYRLHHAVTGAEDGVAALTKLSVDGEDYGASAVFDESEREAAALRGNPQPLIAHSDRHSLADDRGAFVRLASRPWLGM